MAKKDENTIGMLAHLLALFFGFIGPLIIFLIWENKKGNAHANAKNSLNFQLSMLIYYFIGFLLIFALIGIIVLPALALFALILGIVASVKAHNGEVYSYPLTINFIK